MSHWAKFNPNPRSQRVGDCVIRAICKAMSVDWETAFSGIMVKACQLSDMPSANVVWGAYLRENGFRRYIVDDHGQHVYTVDDFCRDHPTGTYVLGIDGHVVCVKDGHYWDTWDSGQEIPIYSGRNKEIGTMETIQAILAVCGGISVIGGAVAVIHKWISPAIKLTTRVKVLEEHDKRDFETMHEIRERDSLIMETLVTMLNSQISGNNVEQLKETRGKLISYLARTQ